MTGTDKLLKIVSGTVFNKITTAMILFGFLNGCTDNNHDPVAKEIMRKQSELRQKWTMPGAKHSYNSEACIWYRSLPVKIKRRYPGMKSSCRRGGM